VAQCFGEGGHGFPCEILQTGVQQGDVFALQQPDAAKLMRQGDVGARNLLRQDAASLVLAVRRQRREDAGNADRRQTRIAHPARRIADGNGIQRYDRAAVVFMPAGHHVHLTAHQGGQILRPVDEWRQAGTGGQADAQGADALQTPPLYHRIGEMGGTDHDSRDAAGIDRRLRQQPVQRGAHAAQHIFRGRDLGRCQDMTAVNQHRIRVGAADVDADAPHGNRPVAVSSGNTVT
jgi:hypothetical protein